MKKTREAINELFLAANNKEDELKIRYKLSKASHLFLTDPTKKHTIKTIDWFSREVLDFEGFMEMIYYGESIDYCIDYVTEVIVLEKSKRELMKAVKGFSNHLKFY